MKGIGGNTTAIIQMKTTTKNALHEYVNAWADIKTLRGWLDLSAGQSGHSPFHAKIQESTHLFICDYVPLPGQISAENARMLIGGKTYDIMLMDNPMGMEAGSQWEFYLKYTGGQ